MHQSMEPVGKIDDYSSIADEQDAMDNEVEKQFQKSVRSQSASSAVRDQPLSEKGEKLRAVDVKEDAKPAQVDNLELTVSKEKDS